MFLETLSKNKNLKTIVRTILNVSNMKINN